MSRSLWLLVLVLIVLHQDNWFWTDDRLVFGFMPIGLLYHVGISLAAGAVWWWATVRCWPSELDEPASQEHAS